MKRRYWQSLVLLACLLLWVVTTGLLAASRGEVQGLLREALEGSARPDAFRGLDGGFFLFWLTHSCLTLTAIAASARRRSDVLIVLLIGPALTLALGCLTQDWHDPDWAILAGICLMGWLASLIVGTGYWGLKPRA